MAIKPLNSVAGFSVGEVPANIILANGDVTAKNAIFSGNLLISNATSSWGILTDNLYYSNGIPWDLQQAAGSNSQVQFNDNQNFGASANFVWDNSQQLLSIIGNLDVTNIVRANYLYANANVLANNVNANSNVNVTGTLLANYISANANITGNILNINANATTNNLTVNNEISGNTANFSGNVFTLNANLGNLAEANYVNVSSTTTTNNLNVNLELAGNTANFSGNVFTLNANLGNLAEANYVNVASNVTTNNLTVNLELTGNTANFSGNVVTLNANLGNLAQANYVNVASNVTTSNLTVNLELAGNTANFAGNIFSLNADLGNLGTANYINVSSNITTTDITVNNNISGNTANFTGNISSLNADLGNLAQANYVNVANDLNVLGNINASNLVGALANGNSNIKVYANSNVEVTVNGVSNVATFTDSGLLVIGNINSTTGNITANGNVIANGFINAANANIAGEALIGSVTTSTINANGGNITISAAGTNESIFLAPSGTGVVDVGAHRIAQLADPLNPNDAATKEYVDSIAQGLTIHTPVRVESNVALTGTYTQGGTTQTTTDITGGKTITFSVNHGLSVNDGIVWTNSFNGIIGGEAYWVYSTPALNQITVKDGYFGIEVTTLTNGTGLTQSSRANPGVGATLVNAGANAALVIDSVSVANGDRVLVYSQANSAENGVYDVTDKGNVSAAWVLTRSSDMDTYIPQSTTGLGYGDYFFIQEGLSAAGESYVLTSPTSEVIIGTDNILFTQFQSAGSYTAGSGINITGTLISANVDNVTTAIVGGNIVVKTSAQLTTPNIDAATGTSLTVTGNVDANNLSITSNANVTLDLTVGNIIQSNGNINSNANVNSNNLFVTNFVDVGANIVGNNISANYLLSATTANISGNTTTGNLTANTNVDFTTAGNVSLGDVSNLHISGGSADQVLKTDGLGNLTWSSGSTLANGYSNVAIPNADGNVYIHANAGVDESWNFSTNGTLTAPGNIIVSNSSPSFGILTDNLYYANGQPWDLQEAAGSNTQIQFNDGLNNFGASANFTFNTSTDTLSVVGSANISNAVKIGNTTTTWGTVTTTTVTANQTISSVAVTGITGVQFFVKAVDATGSKYSVATVQAVTDGTAVDYSTYGTVNLGGYTGSLAVNISGGFLRLQVTPASGNSTVWTTQYNYI